jgi:hypothetical protein
MDDHIEVFVGMDTSNSRIAVALTEAGRADALRFLRKIDADDAAVSRRVQSRVVSARRRRKSHLPRVAQLPSASQRHDSARRDSRPTDKTP